MFSTNTTNKSLALNNKISYGECNGLNIEGDGEVKQILGLGGRIQSNAGEPELLLYIKFKEPVNISGISLECFDKDFLPAQMNIFTNTISIDFGDIENITSTETINLSNNFGKQLPLKIAKFRSVSCLTVKIKFLN